MGLAVKKKRVREGGGPPDPPEADGQMPSKHGRKSGTLKRKSAAACAFAVGDRENMGGAYAKSLKKCAANGTECDLGMAVCVTCRGTVSGGSRLGRTRRGRSISGSTIRAQDLPGA